MNKPVVGQKLFSLNVGNAARRTEQVLTPVIVKKVGRKYFVCGEEGATWRDTQYHLDNWTEKSEYIASSVLYKTEKEWEDEKEMNKSCRFIATTFMHGDNIKHLPLEKIRAIVKLIEGDSV